MKKVIPGILLYPVYAIAIAGNFVGTNADVDAPPPLASKSDRLLSVGAKIRGAVKAPVQPTKDAPTVAPSVTPPAPTCVAADPDFCQDGFLFTEIIGCGWITFLGYVTTKQNCAHLCVESNEPCAAIKLSDAEKDGIHVCFGYTKIKAGADACGEKAETMYKAPVQPTKVAPTVAPSVTPPAPTCVAVDPDFCQDGFLFTEMIGCGWFSTGVLGYVGTKQNCAHLCVESNEPCAVIHLSDAEKDGLHVCFGYKDFKAGADACGERAETMYKISKPEPAPVSIH